MLPKSDHGGVDGWAQDGVVAMATYLRTRRRRWRAIVHVRIREGHWVFYVRTLAIKAEKQTITFCVRLIINPQNFEKLEIHIDHFTICLNIAIIKIHL